MIPAIDVSTLRREKAAAMDPLAIFDLGEEWFHFGPWTFNVSRAKRLIEGRAPVELPLIKSDGEVLFSRASWAVSVSHKRALHDPTTRLEVPVIVATGRGLPPESDRDFVSGECLSELASEDRRGIGCKVNAFLIDGWHRYSKAVQLDRLTILARVLTPGETEELLSL